MSRIPRPDITHLLPDGLVWAKDGEDGVTGASDGEWWHGWVYHRRKKDEYATYLEPTDSGSSGGRSGPVFPTEDEALKYISTMLCLGLYEPGA